ncbi:unnamed protein product, partial [Allacma fusca]
ANFSLLNLNDLIFDVVRENPRTSQESLLNVRSKIQNWVQHAGDKLTKDARNRINAKLTGQENCDAAINIGS